MNVTLYGTRDFADVITSRILRRGDYPGLCGDIPTLSKCHHKSLYKEEGRGRFHTEERR